MNALSRIVADNVARIRQRMAEAAERAGRDPRDVTLVAVTKYVGQPEQRAVLDSGCTDLGESRPRDLWAKADAVTAPEVRWHMIGHLQRNKVRRTLPCLTWLHSGDNLRLLQAVDRIADEQDLTIQVLLEVNISGDPTKHGFAASELESALPQLVALRRLRVGGLMAMAGRGSTPDEARRQFVALRELRDQLRAVGPRELPLDQLSMGMSSDFEQAIEEGATMIRVGSSLFEGLPR